MAATEDYVARVTVGLAPAVDRRELTRDERMEEALFTGLRLVEGVDTEAVGRRFGVDVWERYGEPLQPFLEQGLLCRSGARLRLTRDGMLIANEVLAVFV